MKKTTKIRVTRTGRRLVLGLGLVSAAICSLVLNSCNVTRNMTTQSEYIQRGDTSVVIVTKTIESYFASKKVY